MNKQQKKEMVLSLARDFVGTRASFLVQYTGLKVASMQQLRRSLRDNGGTLKVAKARLMLKAFQGTDNQSTGFQSFFKNQVALVFVKDNEIAVAKVLYDFSRNNKFLKLVAARIDNQLLRAQDVVDIALLPSREVLLARVVGSIQAPLQNFAGILQLLVLRLLMVLKKIEEREVQQ
jgi:large subunit ribosomal protein L10